MDVVVCQHFGHVVRQGTEAFVDSGPFERADGHGIHKIQSEEGIRGRERVGTQNDVVGSLGESEKVRIFEV